MVGEIRLLSFRKNELPDGWHCCDGTRIVLDSPAGQALNQLSESFKIDWGIAIDGCSINFPNLFKDADGYFLRPVNGDARQVGTVQSDAIRNITAYIHPLVCRGSYPNAHGAAFTQGGGTGGCGTSGYWNDLIFDASRAVPTAHENRPVNVGMTPAIYLGTSDVGNHVPDITDNESFAGYKAGGKKVYVKTVYLEEFPADVNGSSFKEYATNISGLERVVDLRVVWLPQSGEYTAFGNLSQFATDTWFDVTPAGIIRVHVNKADRSAINGLATVFYTCTDR